VNYASTALYSENVLNGVNQMRVLKHALVVIALTNGAWAETVTTTDGRKFELNPDGTYRLLGESNSPKIEMEEQKPFFTPFTGEYGAETVRFMPIFSNLTGKTIVGFKFHSEFKSAFGEEVFAFDGESSERIAPKSSSTASAFYFFEDNQFISNEPYDKLKIFESAGTGSISTKVTAVVFDGGEVVKIE
jgi:hypothetical protein